MANPNIVNVTTIYGNTAALVVGTALANIVANPASSGQIIKINNCIVTNANTSTITVTLEYNKAGTNTAIAKAVNVPSAASLVLLGKDTGIYLLENESIQLSASATNSITAVSSFEQIS